MCANVQLKQTTLTFLAQICPKSKLGFEIQKTNVGIRISILEILGSPIFRQNGQLWIFGPKFAKKKNFEVKISKIQVWIWNQHPWHTTSTNFKDNFEFLGPNLPKNEFWGQNFKNLSLDLESASLRYYVHQFSDKTDNFEFLGPNLPKNGFWGRNFKNLSLDSESTPPIYHVCQFSVKMNNF